MNIELPVTYRDVVHKDWVDMNGHMNVAYYSLVFDRAIDGFFDLLDLGFAAIERTGRTMFMTEMHVVFRQEIHEGAPLRASSQLLGYDAKRIHFIHFLHHDTEHFVSATCEFMSLHVDMATRRATPFTDETMVRLDRMKRAHERHPWPVEASRAISLAARRPA